MNIEQAKLIQIEAFLKRLGFEPLKADEHSLWYLSPFRKEEIPSFVVHVFENVWYDHGTEKGGNFLELAKELFHSDNIPYVLSQIELNSPVIPACQYNVVSLTTALEEPITCVVFHELKDAKLLSYFTSRKINYPFVAEICELIEFVRNRQERQAVVFANIHGGYELRSHLYCGHVLPMAISILRENHERLASSCCVFLDFIDYLSYKTLIAQKKVEILADEHSDIIVLNSMMLLSKAFPYLASYQCIYCYLYNDKSGKTATETIQGAFEDRTVIDMATKYAKYRNLNAFLQEKCW